MLTIPRVKQAVHQGDWFTCIDLKDAYFQIPIWEGHRRFLRFAFNGRVFHLQVLPFGLSLAPRTFTGCMDAALAPLRHQGVRILNYLDDWLVCAQSEEICRQHVELVINHIQSLELQLNREKSQLLPSQTAQFLGMNLDSLSMKVSLTIERHQALVDCLSLFRSGQKVQWRTCLRLLCLMAVAAQIIPLGHLFMRPVQRFLLRSGHCQQTDLMCEIPVTRGLLRALRWWNKPTNTMKGSNTRLGPVLRRQLISTDASMRGWGAVLNGTWVRGLWEPPLTSQHINVLELRAIHLALGYFLPHLVDRHVLVRMDNEVAASYVNRQGGLTSPLLCKVAHNLLTWAQPHILSLKAVHLPGLQNQAADMLSRGGPWPGEWRLHPDVVKLIWDHFGMAGVDLFASWESTHRGMHL